MKLDLIVHFPTLKTVRCIFPKASWICRNRIEKSSPSKLREKFTFQIRVSEYNQQIMKNIFYRDVLKILTQEILYSTNIQKTSMMKLEENRIMQLNTY